MTRYVCPVCYFTYHQEDGDPNAGVEPGTPFEEIPENWCCPKCGQPKSEFRKFEE
jgi:rubredoxin